jgi:hypothetical protein
MEGIAAIDLFVVPTIAFKQLFAFLVLRYERRQLLWFAVTRNPMAEWLARQITEAFPWHSTPKYLAPCLVAAALGCRHEVGRLRRTVARTLKHFTTSSRRPPSDKAGAESTGSHSTRK